MTGGLHGHDHRLVVVTTAVAFFAPTGDEQQRVVDRDPQADERDQELDDERDVGQVGDRQQEDERGEDRRRSDHERQHGQEGPEHEREDGQRADRAEQGLPEHACATVPAVAGRERVLAGHPDEGTGGLGRVGRAADGVGG